MRKEQIVEKLREIGLVPVLRAESEEQALGIASAIAAGGVTVLEITMTVPGAIRVMSRLTKDRPDILIGAGTVLDAETARMCMLEGAQFVVSPALNLQTIEMCHRYSIPVLAGALGGAKYLKSLKAPLPQVEMIPTGGVSLATAKEFLEAGSFALGVGADLVDTKAMAAGQPEKITESAKKYLEIVREFRNG